METNELLGGINILEAEYISRGILPDRIEVGAWRPIEPTDGEVHPNFIQTSEQGVSYVPVRLLGPGINYSKPMEQGIELTIDSAMS